MRYAPLDHTDAPLVFDGTKNVEVTTAFVQETDGSIRCVRPQPFVVHKVPGPNVWRLNGEPWYLIESTGEKKPFFGPSAMEWYEVTGQLCG